MPEVNSTDRRAFSLKPYHFLMLLVTFFWAVGHPLGRIILAWIHPFQLAAVNLVFGFIGLFLFMIISGRLKLLKSFSFRDFLHAALLGIFGFFTYQLCTFSALKRIPASMNSVLVSTNVIFIVLFAALIFKEKLSFVKVLGTLIAAAGAVFVVFNQGFRLEGEFQYGGAVFSFAGALSFMIYSLGGKPLLARRDPAAVVTVAIFTGMICLLIFTASTVGFGELKSITPGIWALIAVLGLTMIGIAYPLWFHCLQKAKAAEVSVFVYLVPLYAGILSFIILGERFGWRFYFGAGLIFAGIFFASFIAGRKKDA